MTAFKALHSESLRGPSCPQPRSVHSYGAAAFSLGLCFKFSCTFPLSLQFDAHHAGINLQVRPVSFLWRHRSPSHLDEAPGDRTGSGPLGVRGSFCLLRCVTPLGGEIACSAVSQWAPLTIAEPSSSTGCGC